MHKVKGTAPVLMTGHTLYPAGAGDIGDPTGNIKSKMHFHKGTRNRGEGRGTRPKAVISYYRARMGLEEPCDLKPSAGRALSGHARL